MGKKEDFRQTGRNNVLQNPNTLPVQTFFINKWWHRWKKISPSFKSPQICRSRIPLSKNHRSEKRTPVMD